MVLLAEYWQSIQELEAWAQKRTHQKQRWETQHGVRSHIPSLSTKSKLTHSPETPPKTTKARCHPPTASSIPFPAQSLENFTNARPATNTSRRQDTKMYRLIMSQSTENKPSRSAPRKPKRRTLRRSCPSTHLSPSSLDWWLGLLLHSLLKDSVFRVGVVRLSTMCTRIYRTARLVWLAILNTKLSINSTF